MTKVFEEAARIAKETGRDIVEVIDHMIAVLEGKKAEIKAGTADQSPTEDAGNAQVGETSTESPDSASNTTAAMPTETATLDIDSSKVRESAPAADGALAAVAETVGSTGESDASATVSETAPSTTEAAS